MSEYPVSFELDGVVICCNEEISEFEAKYYLREAREVLGNRIVQLNINIKDNLVDMTYTQRTPTHLRMDRIPIEYRESSR